METILMEFWQFISVKALIFKMQFTEPVQRTFWGYLILFPFMALIPYFLYDKKDKFNFKTFLLYVFPKENYFHSSTKIDLFLFFISRILGMAGLFIKWFSTISIALFVCLKLQSIHYPTWTRFESTPLTIFIFSLFALIAYDFSRYVVHYLGHKIPVFWELHSVHHSAEVLNIFTTFRTHPLYAGIRAVAEDVIFNIGRGILLYVTLRDPNHMLVLKYHIGFMIFHLLGSNFQHSHMWISFGPIFNRIFISPCMHQIHHSADKKHRNKNIGEIFAVWDWMFGTIYIPKEKENLEFGIDIGVKNYHANIISALVDPLKNIMNMTLKKFGIKQGRIKTRLGA